MSMVSVTREPPVVPPIQAVMVTFDAAGFFGLLCYLRNARKEYEDNGGAGSPVAEGRWTIDQLLAEAEDTGVFDELKERHISRR